MVNHIFGCMAINSNLNAREEEKPFETFYLKWLLLLNKALDLKIRKKFSNDQP